MLTALGLSAYIGHYHISNMYIQYLLLAIDAVLILFTASYLIGYALRFWKRIENPEFRARSLRSPNLNNPRPTNTPRPQRPYPRQSNKTPAEKPQPEHKNDYKKK